LLINCGGLVLILRVNLLIHLRKPILDSFYDSLCLLGRGNIELGLGDKLPSSFLIADYSDLLGPEFTGLLIKILIHKHDRGPCPAGKNLFLHLFDQMLPILILPVDADFVNSLCHLCPLS